MEKWVEEMKAEIEDNHLDNIDPIPFRKGQARVLFDEIERLESTLQQKEARIGELEVLLRICQSRLGDIHPTRTSWLWNKIEQTLSSDGSVVDRRDMLQGRSVD